MNTTTARRGLVPALLLCSVVLSGCATILGGDNSNVQVNSDPSDAMVYINGAEVGRTPYRLSYVKEMGPSFTLEVRKEGYRPSTVNVQARARNGVLLADAMLLGIPYIVDSKSNALYQIKGGDIEVSLYKEVQADLQRLDLPVVPMENATVGDRYGKIGSKVVTGSSKEVYDLKYPEMASSTIVRGFSGSWADARNVKLGTVKGDELLQRAKFYVKPRLKRLDLQGKEKSNLVQGSTEITMEWVFLSGTKKDSVLFSVEQTLRHAVSGVSSREMLSQALEASARRLLEDPTMHERLVAAHGRGLVLAKGGEVSLAVPKPIAFTGRKEMLNALVKGVVTVETSDGHGSGFLVTNDGYIMTNAHVVGKDASVKVRFEQGFALDGQVVKVNRDFDLALIKTSGSDLPALTLGDDAGLMLGEEIFAIGTPLDGKLGQSVTRGIMSGRREIEGRSYLQTDVSINPGNSGGPLIDETGKVVGVATLKISAKGVEGIGFGVPITKALEMLNIRFVP